MFFSNSILFNESVVNILHLNVGQWLDYVMIAFTYMGYETFYIAFIAFFYWFIDKRIGMIVGLSLLFSIKTNHFFKELFSNPRPDFHKLTPQIQSIMNIIGKPKSFGFPSGHAQNSVVFWGSLSYQLKNKTFSIASIIFIIFISYSRIYLGVHYLGDVAFGIIIGTLILFVLLFFFNNYIDKILNVNFLTKFSLFIFIIVLIFADYLSKDYIKSFSIFSSFALGYVLLKNKNSLTDFNYFFMFICFCVGILFIVLFKLFMKIFPYSNYFILFEYFIIGLWISYLAPLSFEKTYNLINNKKLN